jgi:hypothetical protein
MVKDLLKECIIVSKKFGNDMVLAKNRDRAYKPLIEVVHTFINGCEVVYLHDITTDWSEGMNEYGIGIVNASLMVGFDEKEKQIISKTGKKSEDGLRIRYALGQKSLKESIKSVVLYDGGVKGHTFLANPSNLITIEMTSKHKAVIKKQDPNSIYVRTNHGLAHPDAGYTEGPDYKSSVIRRASAREVIGKLEDWEKQLQALRSNRFSTDNPNNMSRDTDKMKTTSQMQLNLTKRIFTLNYFGDRVEGFNGIRRQLPSDYTPKIKIRIKNLSETEDN